MTHSSLKKVVLFGESFRVENTITDYDGSTLDPDSHSIQLYKPDGKTQGDAETSPTYVSAGFYYQDFAIPALGPKGEWMVTWIVTVGTENTPERIRIKVVE